MRTKVSWAHFPWNPWWGCQRVGPECDNCYIYLNIRKHHLDAYAPDGPYRTKTWNHPYAWQRQMKPGEYARIFCVGHGDFFDRRVDSRGWRDEAWSIIRNTPNLVYLVLTKRPERIADHLPQDWPYPNVWLGTSVGCRATLSRVDHLRKIPIHDQAVRMLSCEPLLENISAWLNLDGIGWLIVGGESGDNPETRYDPKMKSVPGRRYMDPVWAYRLMLRARRAGIPFYFKQVTATRAAQGIDALGEIYHEYPNPPGGGVWVAENPLKVIQGETE
jgi:protein gp37